MSTILEEMSESEQAIFDAQTAEIQAHVQQINNLALCIAADSNESPDAVIWRDSWCYECGRNECISGTARDLAEKIYKLGWMVENLRLFNLICPDCIDKPEDESSYARQYQAGSGGVFS